MTTTTRPRGGATGTRPATWVCENCSRESRAQRKRCGECGTSRY